jgi:hypothetical protein
LFLAAVHRVAGDAAQQCPQWPAQGEPGGTANDLAPNAHDGAGMV